LLLTIEGMHAMDYLNCLSGEYCHNLAALGETGVKNTLWPEPCSGTQYLRNEPSGRERWAEAD